MVTRSRNCEEDDDLNDADFVGDVEGIVVGSQAHVRLLHAIRTDERVDFGNIDLVKLLHRLLDLRLVGLKIDDEDEGVVVLDLLHGGFGGERVADDRIGVHAISVRCTILGELGRSLEPQSLRATELDGSSHFLHSSSEAAFDDLLFSGESLGSGGRLGHFLLGFDLLDGFGVFLGHGLLSLGRGLGFGRFLGLWLLSRRRLLLSFLARHDGSFFKSLFL